MENSKFYPILQDMTTTTLQMTDFYATLEKAISDSWQQEKIDHYLTHLGDNLNVLCEQLIQLGDEQAEVLDLLNPSQVLEGKSALIFHYGWIDVAKSFLVLWRNTLFENQKAAILVLDKKVSADGLKKMQADSKANIEGALENLNACFDKITTEISSTPKDLLKTLEKWYRQDSPWPNYRKQIETLQLQTDGLVQQQSQLNTVHGIIQNIEQLSIESVHHCQSEINSHREIAQESLAFIGEFLNTQTSKIPVLLENQEDKLLTEKHNRIFSSALEKEIAELSGQINLAITSQAGVLHTRDIDFKRDISQWLDAEILPLLMEVWELTIHVRNNLKMALINIRNRAIVLQSDQKDGQEITIEQDDICQPLNSFLQQSEDRLLEQENLHQLIHNRLDQHFQLSGLFNNDDSFLSLQNQSALTQLRSNQNEILEKTVTWWKQQVKRVNRWLSSVQEEDALSTSEKIVRFLQNKSPRTNNQSYNGIFMTKGYIGESFWVGRDQELKRIGTLIRQWEKGYRGTVLLTANRFAGKSLFGDLVSNRYFAQSTIRLLPNSTIKLKGRTFSTTYNLGEALDFISKYSVHNKVLVWLDDLELWHDPSQPMSQNIDDLLQHIDRHFGHIFYLISLSTHLKKQLDKSHGLNRSFQAEIKLNTMTQESIHEAILIRHGATHKQLVNDEGVEITPDTFKNMTARTQRSGLNNIGTALHLWSCSIQPKDNDQVVYRTPIEYILPDFLEIDSALILRALYLEKRSTEYRLRKRFGPAFKPKYAEALLRLQSIGLVKRQLDGWLEINDLAVNEVIALLEENEYL